MKVKGPKNQADFIEVLYVVVPGAPVFEIHGNMVRQLLLAQVRMAIGRIGIFYI